MKILIDTNILIRIDHEITMNTLNTSNMLPENLKDKLHPRNGAGLLKLAGIVKNAPADASVNPAIRIPSGSSSLTPNP